MGDTTDYRFDPIPRKAKRRHLSASECYGLSRGKAGSQSITEPFSVNLHINDPNHGLQPRTPTKRRRRATEGGRHQRGITEFFASTGVLSSSPQKGKNEPTVKTEDEQNGHVIPKEEDEEQEVTEDYMEGITEDMFEDDEEFEMSGSSIKKEEDEEGRVAGCSSWGTLSGSTFSTGHSYVTVKKEEEEYEDYPVESLPDVHYGLLGVNGGLDVPQGQFQDLPEEILSVIFAHLPADDLYRHVSLVCHRWRDIVTDPQFMPWKKLYYRYEKWEEEAVKEVKALLNDNSIIKTDDLCVLNMVRYMSRFKHSRRVNVKDVSLSVKGHRLYAQAEACMKHRLPDMEIIDGEPNPWSLLALMLILADGVKDVLDLVARLRTSGCLLTPGGVSEYLWAVATLLLAMRNTNITISNRWHYNIFYVLHLIENAPPPLSPGDGSQKQFQVTHEQQQILNHDIQRDHVVKIMAFAGTGKTTTLVKYAQRRPDLRFLYVSFNKSVATQADSSFPCNVECRTIHSMAYKAVGHRYRNLGKLCNNVQPFTVAWKLPEGRGGFVNAKVVTQTINNFCASTDTYIGTQHVPKVYRNTNGRDECPDEAKKMLFAGDAQDIWDKMIELEPTRETAYHMTHDGYLKLWQMQRPVLKGYDVIFIDEAQDCTPVIMDIMLSQRCGKILVGDPHQQIYTFRGAVNALYAVPHTHLYYLTQSFRFGSEIAYIGATILDVCKKVKKILVGGHQDGSVRGEDRETLESIKQATTQVRGKVAILCRCNVTVFSEAVRLTDANSNCKIHIVGGVENFGLKKILDIWILMQPEVKRMRDNLRIKDSFIRSFCKEKLGGYAGLKKYATHTEDRELEAKLSVVEKYNARIPELVERIYNCAQRSPDTADYILGTVHKSKGLEFDTVVVTDDFMKVPCSRHNLQRMNISPGIRNVDGDEWNLLYVAVTRARRSLYITKSICNILTLAGEYFLRSELSSTLLNKDESVRCSTRECPNLITKESPLSMCKVPVRHMDSVEEGGVLCATCVEQRVGPVAFLLSPPEKVRAMHYTEERLELPINISMLLALL
ncbi:F-box DNA helicase 1 isoform X2 [Colossoma macropomum]|uniref:F-box DNA helicase 1 isoform X2 n=1 Tax=Colossoma macropomum TaxID=42526 RepID=UPI00186479B1|nr:F-box DNA helicase 1 isoform X2 [Colossoma macropomum]